MKDNLINYIPAFSADMYNMIACFNKDNDDDFIKVFNCFVGKEHQITSEVMAATLQYYFDTKDTHYLTEAAIMLLMLHKKHQLEVEPE